MRTLAIAAVVALLGSAAYAGKNKAKQQEDSVRNAKPQVDSIRARHNADKSKNKSAVPKAKASPPTLGKAGDKPAEKPKDTGKAAPKTGAKPSKK